MSHRVIDINGKSDDVDLHGSSAFDPQPERLGSAYALYFVGGAASSIAAPSMTSTRTELNSGNTMLLDHSGSCRLPSDVRQNKSLGIFSLQNPLRIVICDILTQQWMEPLSLFLIVLQNIFLIIAISTSTIYSGLVPSRFGSSWISYCFLVIFIVFTLELVMRIIASGFVLDYADPVEDPRRQELSFPIPSNKPSPFRSRKVRQDHLTRRPFLRNFFNILDFVAIISFWIIFIISLTSSGRSGFFRVCLMLSALRILRLLRVTVGTHIETTVVFGGLKKAAPTLRRVVLFIGFFWLLFAVVGIQSFKSSLRRSCQWQGLHSTKDSPINTFQFFGGQFDKLTGQEQPWLKSDGSYGAESHTGYLCARGSLCQETVNPYNNSVSFDNIFHSLELIFVIMSANTFSEIMYYLMDSAGLTAALFFAIAIIVLYYWLIILLVGIVTSSFHGMREGHHKTKSDGEGETRHESRKRNESSIGHRHSSLQTVFRKTKWAWIVTILYGLVIQALRTASMSKERERFLDRSEMIVTSILLFEIVLRFTIDTRNFHRSKQNLADLAIASITSIIQLPVIKNSGRIYPWLTFFQIIRVYRIVWAVPLAKDLVVN